MPKFFFNVRDGVPIIRDHVGTDLPNMAAAVERARRIADRVVGGLLEQPDLFEDLHVEICDATGNILRKIELPDVETFRR